MGRGILGLVFSGMWSLPALMAVDVCRCKAAFVIGLNVEISFEFFQFKPQTQTPSYFVWLLFYNLLAFYLYKKKYIFFRVCTLILDHPQLYCLSCI